MQMLLCTLIYVSVMGISVVDSSGEQDGVLDKIKAGLEYATNYLETARDIADLVARSLGGKQKEKRGDEGTKEKGGFLPASVMSAFFRLIGLDSQKVTAIAVNSVIFLAQMISSLFELKPSKGNIGRNLDDEEETSTWNPAKLIMESKNERIQKLIEHTQNEHLPDQLMQRVDGLDSACIRLLLCKTSPVIRAAQNSLKITTQGESRGMTGWLPSRDEFEENNDRCEVTHNDCELFS